MSKQEIDFGLLIFNKIQDYGYFNSFKLSKMGGINGIIHNPLFNPALIINYINIHKMLKLTAGGWIYTALQNSGRQNDIKNNIIVELIKTGNTRHYDYMHIEKMLQKELNL
jgi:hypothetical protein